MNCPQDSSYLDYQSDPHTGKTKYLCAECGGVFEHASYDDESRYNLFEPELPGKYADQDFQCPYDESPLYNHGDYYTCYNCNGRWKVGLAKSEKTGFSKNRAAVVIAEFSGLFLMAITLFAWQLGAFASFADPVSATATVPVKAFVILIWFVTFTLVFLLPATIYEQMVLAHRPHFNKASHHPLVRWLPVIVISIMAINIYFFTP